MIKILKLTRHSNNNNININIDKICSWYGVGNSNNTKIELDNGCSHIVTESESSISNMLEEALRLYNR